MGLAGSGCVMLMVYLVAVMERVPVAIGGPSVIPACVKDTSSYEPDRSGSTGGSTGSSLLQPVLKPANTNMATGTSARRGRRVIVNSLCCGNGEATRHRTSRPNDRWGRGLRESLKQGLWESTVLDSGPSACRSRHGASLQEWREAPSPSTAASLPPGSARWSRPRLRTASSCSAGRTARCRRPRSRDSGSAS